MQFRVLTISPYILKFRASWRRQRGERGQTSPRIQPDDDCSLLSLISVPWSAPASAQARTCYCLPSAHTFTVMSPHRRAACHSQLLFKMCWRGLAPLQPQLVSLWQHENNPEMGAKLEHPCCVASYLRLLQQVCVRWKVLGRVQNMRRILKRNTFYNL